MEHTRLKADIPRCPMPDFKAYEANMDRALTLALELRGLLENHLGAHSEAVKAYGHDINNAVAGLNSVVVLSADQAAPLHVVNTLLATYPERVSNALNTVRPHVTDESILQKLDTLQATTNGLFDRLHRARENYAEQVTGFPYHQISNVKVLGTVGPEGQKGIMV